MRPNKVNIRKWVEALRSGKYEQGTGALRKGGKLCCLGVACEAAIQNGVKIEVTATRGDAFFRYNGVLCHLPEPVQTWLGIPKGDPGLYRDEKTDGELRAIHANDDMGLSFTAIADLVERNYLSK